MDRNKRNEFDNYLILDMTFFAFDNDSYSLRQRFNSLLMTFRLSSFQSPIIHFLNLLTFCKLSSILVYDPQQIPLIIFYNISETVRRLD